MSAEKHEQMPAATEGCAAADCSRTWCRWTVFRKGKERQCEGKPGPTGFCSVHAYLAIDFPSENDKLTHGATP